MTDVASYNKRMVEEQFFSVLRSYLMKVPILNRVVIVPVEPRAMDERIFGLSHGFSIYLIYTRVQELTVALDEVSRSEDNWHDKLQRTMTEMNVVGANVFNEPEPKRYLQQLH